MEQQLILSPSRVRRWVRCKKSYYWKYYRRLNRVRRDSAPELGLVVGESLAEYYRKGQTQEIIEAALKEILYAHSKVLFSEGQPKFDTEDWNKVVRVSTYCIKDYHEWAFQHDQFKVLEVEQARKIKLTPQLSLLAIPDALIEAQGDIWILEHKVRYRYKPADFGIDYQSAGTCLACNAIGTAYNVFEYSKGKKYRNEVVRSPNELSYFKDLYISIGEDILSTPVEKLYPQPMKRCSCEYWELCNAEITGADVEDVINVFYETRPEHKVESKDTEEPEQ